MERYQFTSYEQIDLFYNYLENLVKVFLNQGGPTENSAFGALVERTINQTYAQLNLTLPLEVLTRNVAQQINSLTDLDCAYYINQAVTDLAQ